MAINNTLMQTQQDVAIPQLLLLHFLSSALKQGNFTPGKTSGEDELKNSLVHEREQEDCYSIIDAFINVSLSNDAWQRRQETKLEFMDNKLDSLFMTVVKDRDDKSDLLVSKFQIQEFSLREQFKDQESKLKELSDKMDNGTAKLQEEMHFLETKLHSTLDSKLKAQENLITSQFDSMRENLLTLERKIETILESVEDIREIESHYQAANAQCQSQLNATSEEVHSLTHQLTTLQKQLSSSEEDVRKCGREAIVTRSLLNVSDEQVQSLTIQLNNTKELLNSTEEKLYTCKQEVITAKKLLTSEEDDARACRRDLNGIKEFATLSQEAKEEKLIDAAKEGNETAVKVLLLVGTNASMQNSVGDTPLHWAAREGHVGVARLLIDAGAQLMVKAGSNGHTPLHVVGFSENVEAMARLLVERGADLEAVEKHKQTPLHWAAGRWKSLPAVQALVALGANMAARDDQNRTPLELARELDIDEVADWLAVQ
ncbi:receptor-interacting serine/threonine-protein kinase 4-like [Periplaneta americana]|uniref:receptor-interacting serine/threonine-protein kinase 4-like n=1 Tax=Periplaneta americana TaxID=6978 RepID=UPI0037E755DF